MVLIWGTTWAAVRLSLDGYPPMTGLALRFALGSAVLFAFGALTGARYRPDRQLWMIWLVQCTLAFGVSYGLVYWAEQWVPTGLTAVLFSTFPLFVALFAYPLLPAERLGGSGLLGVLAGFLGVGVIFSDDLEALGGPQVAFAAAVLLIGPLCAAFAHVVVRRWGGHYSSMALTGPPMAMSAVVIGTLAWLFESQRPIDGGLAPTLAIVYLALFGSALAFGLFFWLLRYLHAIQLSLITFATPVVALAIGSIFLDEAVTLKVMVGTLMVIGGIAAVARR